MHAMHFSVARFSISLRICIMRPSSLLILSHFTRFYQFLSAVATGLLSYTVNIPNNHSLEAISQHFCRRISLSFLSLIKIYPCLNKHCISPGNLEVCCINTAYYRIITTSTRLWHTNIHNHLKA